MYLLISFIQLVLGLASARIDAHVCVQSDSTISSRAGGPTKHPSYCFNNYF